MRLGVVQHRLRTTTTEDVHAMFSAVRELASRGAELVIIPCVAGIASDEVRDGVCAAVRDAELPCGLFGPTCYAPGEWGVVDSHDRVQSTGPILALCGDTCFDPDVWKQAAELRPAIAVMSPLSESELQAEAAIEVAIGLSDSLCGLVVVAECAGAEIGAPGHGGSAVVLLGDVVTEALPGPGLLVADVELPIAQPEPKAPYPVVPTLLTQRLAVHAGRRPDAGYLADLSDGLRVR